MGAKHRTDEERAMMIELYKSGLGAQAVANAVGCSKCCVRGVIKRALGGCRPPQAPRRAVTSPGPEPGTLRVDVGGGQFALIDSGDAELIGGYTWRHRDKGHRSTLRYAVGYKHGAGRGSRKVLMHQLLAPPGAGVVRHLNGDSLDNRRSNLARGAQRQNMQETSKHLSGHLPGTTYLKNGRWQAQAVIGGRSRYLGTFDTESAAHMAYVAKLEAEGLPLPLLNDAQREKLG